MIRHNQRSFLLFRQALRIASCAVLLATCLTSSLPAQDWPRWMGPQGDGVWRETGIIESFPESGAKISWRVPVGGGYAGPAIAGGKVFVLDRTQDEGAGGKVENDIRSRGEIAGGERIQCLDLATGEKVWEHSWNAPYKIAYPTGPRCTPTIDGGHVYVLGAMGHLCCLQRDDGKVVWEKSLIDEYKTKAPPWGYSSHPLIDGNRLIVPVGGEGTGIVAFDKGTGKELWRNIKTLDVAYAPTVIMEPSDESGKRQLIFWHAEGIASLDPETGAEYWTFKFPAEKNPSETSICTPRIVNDSIFISEYYKGSVYLRVKDNPPAAEGIWQSFEGDPRHEKSLNCMMSTPVVRDGFAYGIGFDGRGNGVFRCIELESGEERWSKTDWIGDEPLMFSTAFMVENEGRTLMFNDLGELMIVKLSPEGFELLSRAKILEPTSVARGRKVVWSHPAFAQGMMLARNDQEIVCVDLRRR